MFSSSELNVNASVLLHSPARTARWSYFCTRPIAKFTARGTLVERNGKPLKPELGQPPLDALKATFAAHACTHALLRDPLGPPFQGGAVGYLSYETLHYLEDVPLPKADDVQAPWLHFLFFDAGLAFDHVEKKVHAFGPVQKATRLLNQLPSLEDATGTVNQTTTGQTGSIRSNFTRRQYVSAVRKIKEKIAAGETFQANLSQRFEAVTTRTPESVFARLCEINPSPYSALFQTPELSIASASPELLFSIEGRHIATRPIAGTRPRGKTPAEDRKLETELKENAKENAEHAMLVDLERNDLGKICRPGSVKVAGEFAVEKYSHVQHLVSQVEGRLLPDKNAFDALRALFPGGTITGCPKVRTMRILREIEPVARGPYTGSLGWIGWNGDAAFNILIRTLYFKESGTGSGKRSAYFHAGGGIVADSVPEKEYDESLQKAEAMKRALSD